MSSEQPETLASFSKLETLYHLPLVPAERAGLQRASYLLERLGSPHRSFRSVHVTGSCGKGSTTTMVASILQASAFRTGLFTSPHLNSFRERIEVDGVRIDADSWNACFARVWLIVESMLNDQDASYRLGRPALFEVLFALAALHFAEQNVEWAGVEVGLGGRLDATNLLSSDVAVITNVSLEHTQVLGNSVQAIAVEKAAIIKAGCSAITGADDVAALDVIEARASQMKVPLVRLDRDLQVATVSRELQEQVVTFTYAGVQIGASLGLGGDFQGRNAGLSFGAARLLQERGVALPDAAIVEGLGRARIPGRFELVSQRPRVLLDGAHTAAAAWRLRGSLEGLLPGIRLVMLFAAMDDKDVESMARALGPICERVVVTHAPGTERSAPPDALARVFERHSECVVAQNNSSHAMKEAMKQLDSDSMLLITGSLYLVGYCREILMAAGATS